MRLSDLVQIDSRFEKSVNLFLDLNDKKKINAYIPTRSSVNLLKSYLGEVSGFSGGRANILIGPYGKGKSHLLLVLMNILSGENTEELHTLIEKIRNIDEEAARVIQEINKTYRFLPVIINTNSGTLGQAFIRSINQALRREGLQDIVPDNYFSEALKTIRQWKELYPSTYESLVSICDIPVDILINNLESYDYNALDAFRKYHPLLTSGSEFNPVIDDDAISAYRSINRLISERYGYTGIYVIFDEFSKYIEGHSEDGFSADMKMLQDVCELCNSSRDEQLHLTCVAHKAIRAYGDSLSKTVMNAFRGVEGRLTEMPFVVSSQNNYELIADAICKKEEFNIWKSNEEFRALLRESYSISEFSTLFEKKDYYKIVGEGCFPLTPLATSLLMSLSEKIAQNERTLFTFLSGKDLHSLNSFINSSDEVSYAGTGLIYEYFLPLFEGEKNTMVHNEWLKAEYALKRLNNKNEQDIIKSLAIIKMVNRPDDIPSNAMFLRLASGMRKADFETAIESLISNRIVAYKKNAATYEFQNKISVDVENEVTDCALKYYSRVDVPSILNDVCRKRYILPKKYNQDHSMTRYYRVVFMNENSFNALESADYLNDENKPDGYVIVICTNPDTDCEALKAHAAGLDEHNIVLGIPSVNCCITDSVRTLLAVRRLQNDQVFVSENEIIVSELQSLENELVESINQWIEDAVSSISVLHDGTRRIEIDHLGINRAVSDICERVYYKAPLINHELINRHSISAQVSKARTAIMDNILYGRELDHYNTGTSAESTIYRALMLHTKGDENLLLIKKEILKFIHECKGKKVPFSVLINKLTNAPFGMRKGPIPVYIMEQLTELEDMPVVYFGKKELAIDALLLSNIMQKPEEYSLYVEEETGQKLEYIEKLEKLFWEYRTYCRGIENRNRLSKLTCTIQSWYRSLPQTSTTFRKPDYKGQDIRKIDSFRKVFSGPVNPREVLFDLLPKIFNGNSFSDTFDSVKKIKEELDVHIYIVKENAVRAIRAGLSLDEKDDLLICLKEWYYGLPDNVKNSLLSADSQRLLGIIREIEQTNTSEIAEKFSKEITGFFIEDWNDDSISVFSAGLHGLVSEVEEKSKKSDTGLGQKIIISTSNGAKECLYDFDPDNLSASGYFFQNALDDMLEEYGDSLETNEKIGILMQVVRKLMG